MRCALMRGQMCAAMETNQKFDVCERQCPMGKSAKVQDEDLVIDGETAVDDLQRSCRGNNSLENCICFALNSDLELVAQRIAQQEEFAEQVLRDGGGGDGARRRAPSAQDVQKLLRLLRETSKLASKIGELPSQFDALVSEEAREACRAAAQAVTKLPLPESSVMEEDTPVGEENWGEWTDDPMHALAAVDLQSTEEEADEAEPSHAAAEPKQAQRAVEGDEEEEEPEVKEDGHDEIAAPLQAKPEAEGKPAIEDEEGAPVIHVSQLPEWLEDAAPKEPVGKVQSIVQDLLIIQGGEDSKALDLGSVVCEADGRVLGAVVDVFGQISRPHYLVLPCETCKKDLPVVGAAVLAATGMEETSFLCDSTDLAALQQLEDGSDEDSDLVDSGESESEASPTFTNLLTEGAAALEAASRNLGGVWAQPQIDPKMTAESASLADCPWRSPTLGDRGEPSASASARCRFNGYGSSEWRQAGQDRGDDVVRREGTTHSVFPKREERLQRVPPPPVPPAPPPPPPPPPPAHGSKRFSGNQEEDCRWDVRSRPSAATRPKPSKNPRLGD
ncbi:unnamed protein product [Durusdinium trenchii]|uniref:H/ACA ribonucleoprotein complex non-core subunit NAF1 n=1 Tax=Durusdinium trenchii TaxID=1381693 RepID=A0ABP0QV90_9DINO